MKLINKIANLQFVIYFLILIFSCNIAYAQRSARVSDRLSPTWLKQKPETMSQNLQFVTLSFFSTDLTYNRGIVLDMLSTNLPRSWNVSSRIHVNDTGHTEQSLNGIESAKHVQEFTMQVICDGVPVDIKCELVDNYWEQLIVNNGVQYKHSQLYQIASPDYAGPFLKWSKTTKYYFQHVWPSFIIPGSGQMIKGDWLKGGLMMGGAVLFAGGIAGTELTRQVYLGKIEQQRRNDEAVKIYANRAGNLAIGRNICIGGLCAVYIYNIIDAFVAPGARRVEVIPNGVAVNF